MFEFMPGASGDGHGAERPIVKKVFIDAEPRTVYAYLCDPEKFMRWMGTSVELDARPGGVFRVVPNAVDVIRGRFVDCVPYSRVVFTWGFDGEEAAIAAGSTLVEITLDTQDAGTWLQLVHWNLRGDARERHAFGWAHYLSRIKSAAEGRDPGPDLVEVTWP